MKFTFRTGLAVALGMSLMAAPVAAQGYGQPFGQTYGPSAGQPQTSTPPAHWGNAYQAAPRTAQRPTYGQPSTNYPQAYQAQRPAAPPQGYATPVRYPLQGAPRFQGPAYPASYGYAQDELPSPTPDPGVAPAPMNLLDQYSPSDLPAGPVEMEPRGSGVAPMPVQNYPDHEIAPHGGVSPYSAPAPAAGGYGEMHQGQMPYGEMDSGAGYGYPSTGCGNGYDQALSGNWQGTVWEDASGCGTSAACGSGPRGMWFGGVYGLIMNRSYETPQYLSYDPGMPSVPTLTSNSADLGTLAGYEVAFGRQMCNGWAWQASYWGLMSEETMARDGNMPDTFLYGLGMVDYDPVGYANDSVQDWFNGAAAHEVYRRNEFHNVELNLIRYNIAFPSVLGGALGQGSGGSSCGIGGCGSSCGDDCGTSCRSWSGSMFAGARFFKFDEFFSYRSSYNGLYNYDVRDMFYDIDVENNLVGFQFGGNVNYALGCRWSVFAGSKLGIYNNHINHYSRIYGVSGDAMPNSGPYAGDDYAIRSSTNSFSFLSEFNLGLGYQFSPCWRVVGGYRLMGATGIALSPNQIPNNFTYTPGVAEINNDGSLLLHGAFVGLEFAR